jgi:hypothetical protein
MVQRNSKVMRQARQLDTCSTLALSVFAASLRHFSKKCRSLTCEKLNRKNYRPTHRFVSTLDPLVVSLKGYLKVAQQRGGRRQSLAPCRTYYHLHAVTFALFSFSRCRSGGQQFPKKTTTLHAWLSASHSMSWLHTELLSKDALFIKAEPTCKA